MLEFKQRTTMAEWEDTLRSLLNTSDISNAPGGSSFAYSHRTPRRTHDDTDVDEIVAAAVKDATSSPISARRPGPTSSSHPTLNGSYGARPAWEPTEKASGYQASDGHYYSSGYDMRAR